MADLLSEIKTRLCVTGEFHDNMLSRYAEDVKQFLISGGVSPEVAESSQAYGIIALGVSNLWTGGGEFSETFKQRMLQLKYEDVKNV